MNKSRDFRDALGRYPTGVAIISARVSGQPVGVTVNSFASVSLDPPLVLWSIERDRERYELFAGVEDYVINILAADQSSWAHGCAQDADLARCGIRFSGGNLPMIDGCVAHLCCKRTAVHPGGDHDIIVGEVLDFQTGRDVPALLFYRGAYGVPG